VRKFLPRNGEKIDIKKIYQENRKAIFSEFYNISPPNFGSVLLSEGRFWEFGFY
jgi:hypothetical protein